MRRKLIDVKTFQNIEKSSLTSAAAELDEASSILSDILETGLNFHCYDSENVYFETDEGNFVHANYQINDESINLTNIEEVLIDVDSQVKSRKELVANMVEAIVSENPDKARNLFHRFSEMAVPKMRYMKGRKEKTPVKKMADNAASNVQEGTDLWGVHAKDSKRAAAAKKGHSSNPMAAKKGWMKRKKHKSKIDQLHNSPNFKAARQKAERVKATGNKRARVKGVRIQEMAIVGNNVLQFVEHSTQSPIVQEIKVGVDKMDNVTAVSIPTSFVRNEGKIIQMKFDTLKTDVKVLREQAKTLSQDENFQKSVVDLKRYNNLSADEKLAEALHNIVSTFPNVLYLTQTELSKAIAEALHSTGSSNYDDQVCDFMAEGILRTAFGAYPERVNKLANLAKVSVNEAEVDNYVNFEKALDTFMTDVDQQYKMEMKIFADLRGSLVELYNAGEQMENNAILEDTSKYIEKIDSILEGKSNPSISFIEEVAAYITILAEGNLGMDSWKVDAKPYVTDNGSEPATDSYARFSYTPASDYNSVKPGTQFVSDGKSFNATEKGFAYKDGLVVNPYLPKAMDYTMKGEKSADGDNDGLAQKGGDTWPELNNPGQSDPLANRKMSD